MASEPAGSPGGLRCTAGPWSRWRRPRAIRKGAAIAAAGPSVRVRVGRHVRLRLRPDPEKARGRGKEKEPEDRLRGRVSTGDGCVGTWGQRSGMHDDGARAVWWSELV